MARKVLGVGQAIRKILIANRGEIAVRIMRTCHRLGIETVAIYSDVDRQSEHVKHADSALYLGGASPRESYLNGAKIIALAQAHAVCAIHPGYGFLSEQAFFAKACQQAGLIFIGPSAEVIETMGSKVAAKEIARSCGVPTIPGYNGSDQSLACMEEAAETIGYPVLLKAALGGGGKGMHVVSARVQLRPLLEKAKSEAQTAFGDDHILVEKYFPRVRHIEVQIAADDRGQVVHLFERDCSLQRRYQKVMEESPALSLPAALQGQLYEAAIRLAKKAGYVGLGTVEFIVDMASLDQAQPCFYFLEMNTRIQVEHPVTELITGEDLVAWQIRIHQGEGLPKRQQEIHRYGHSCECRIYAEDPAHAFLPATGRIFHWQPWELAGGRFDSGISSGEEISIYYDPLLVKVIAHGADRIDCLQKMEMTLRKTKVWGLQTNQNFLLAVLNHPDFRRGHLHTRWLEEQGPSLHPTEQQIGIAKTLVAIAMLADHLDSAQEEGALSFLSPSWTQGHSYWQEDLYCYGSELWRVSLRWHSRQEGWLWLEALGNSPPQKSRRLAQPSGSELAFRVMACKRSEAYMSIQLEWEGRREEWHVGLEDLKAGSLGPHSLEYDRRFWCQAHWQGQVWRRSRFPSCEQAVAPGIYAAPLTGRVQAIYVSPGMPVQQGQRLLTMEAMKMEHTLVAKEPGVVQEIRVKAGELCEAQSVLITLANEANAK